MNFEQAVCMKWCNFVPCHSCVDNIIHSVSGIQLRLYCDELMNGQGYDESTGKAKITPAFNLPCSYVLHTVGPIVSEQLTKLHCRQLADCYKSCLQLKALKNIGRIGHGIFLLIVIWMLTMAHIRIFLNS